MLVSGSTLSPERQISSCGIDHEELRVTAPRSPFLVQLAHQYETARGASKRRAQAREAAGQSYGEKPKKQCSRHLVWA